MNREYSILLPLLFLIVPFLLMIYVNNTDTHMKNEREVSTESIHQRRNPGKLITKQRTVYLLQESRR